MFVFMFVLFIMSLFMTFGVIFLNWDFLSIILSIFINISLLFYVYVLAIIDKNNNEVLKNLKNISVKISQLFKIRSVKHGKDSDKNIN